MPTLLVSDLEEFSHSCTRSVVFFKIYVFGVCVCMANIFSISQFTISQEMEMRIQLTFYEKHLAQCLYYGKNVLVVVVFVIVITLLRLLCYSFIILLGGKVVS